MSKKLSVSELLRANNKKEEKKSNVPTVTGMEAMVDEIRNSYEKFIDAETVFRGKESSFLQLARKEYEKRAVKDEFTKSLNFDGQKTEGIQVTWTDQFSAVSIENETQLKQNLGDSFEKVFREKREIILKKTDDDIVKKLISKLGQKLFEEMFDIKVSLVPQKEMDRKQFSLPEEVRDFVKQYKASVKMRKE